MADVRKRTHGRNGDWYTMSYADKVFTEMCRDILENGTSTEGEKVRPHWPDGTPAYTIKKFGVVNRYDLSKEFPIMTLRRTALKFRHRRDFMDLAAEVQQYSRFAQPYLG